MGRVDGHDLQKTSCVKGIRHGRIPPDFAGRIATDAPPWGASDPPGWKVLDLQLVGFLLDFLPNLSLHFPDQSSNSPIPSAWPFPMVLAPGTPPRRVSEAAATASRAGKE
jgi:hypothetical protein